jgi:Rhodopirellula transposase DDE domain
MSWATPAERREESASKTPGNRLSLGEESVGPCMVDCAQHTGLTVRLASSPPSHREDNPMERCWGILENHGNGALLDAMDTVIPFATTMTWKGTCPVVELVTTTYQSGVKRTKNAMQLVEMPIQRLPG